MKELFSFGEYNLIVKVGSKPCSRSFETMPSVCNAFLEGLC